MSSPTPPPRTRTQVPDLYDAREQWASFIINAIKAKELFLRDTSYIVRNQEVGWVGLLRRVDASGLRGLVRCGAVREHGPTAKAMGPAAAASACAATALFSSPCLSTARNLLTRPFYPTQSPANAQTDVPPLPCQVIIVDEFTGRTMPGRRWSDGLHQAIEAKEGLPIQNETVTLASISYQVGGGRKEALGWRKRAGSFDIRGAHTHLHAGDVLPA
jgi:hypothetical protein